jgi:anthranilate phosphoribosyltransferase
MMGPIINPSFPKNQLVGVYDLDVMDLYHQVFSDSGQNYTIVNSLDGYDEISLTGDARFVSNLTEDNLSPADFGLARVSPEELYGGETVEAAAKIFKSVLEGNGTEAQQNVVIANTALGIQCMFPEKSLTNCVAEARESLESKRALAAFRKLIELNV